MPFLPQIWPVLNTINIILMEEGGNPNDKLQNYEWYHELFYRHLRLSTYIIVAYVAYIFTFPHSIDSLTLTDLFTYWVVLILIRDCIVTYLFYGYWHWLLYDSSMAKKMRPKKFNPVYPDAAQWSHDRFWTFSGTFISTIFEIFVLFYLKQCGAFTDTKMNEEFAAKESFWQYPINSIFWMLFIPYWRDFHFYWIHRVMHPWFSNKNKNNNKNSKDSKNGKNNSNDAWYEDYDLGRWLYRHVHSLHHKSYNTGPWSGLSMHPVEHIIYYSCVLLPLFIMLCFGLPQHGMHFLFNKFHATISPLPGHDGFDAPGGGSYFHYLHHSHFQCNYGTPMVPFDKLFGTYEDGAKFRKDKKFDSVKEFMKVG